MQQYRRLNGFNIKRFILGSFLGAFQAYGVSDQINWPYNSECTKLQNDSFHLILNCMHVCNLKRFHSILCVIFTQLLVSTFLLLLLWLFLLLLFNYSKHKQIVKYIGSGDNTNQRSKKTKKFVWNWVNWIINKFKYNVGASKNVHNT